MYSLRKSRNILKTAHDLFRKKGKKLPAIELAAFETDLRALDTALLNEDRIRADQLAHKIESFIKIHFKKSFSTLFIELIIALAIALLVAMIVRTMWFEHYEIPTGSMRPTFKEQDHLIVSKTTFGIDFPFETKHLYFDPNLVQRGSTLIFSGDGIDLPDTDTTYFGIIPYKKRYVKRCLGKPEDTLYFYGGRLFGIDRDGNEIPELLEGNWLEKLEYIPFISFEGKRVSGTRGLSGVVDQLIFKQMNIPIGRLIFEKSGSMRGEIFNGNEWIKDNPETALKVHDSIENYNDFWGMRNFAMARLLTKNQVKELTPIPTDSLEEAPLYLEIRHNPGLSYPQPRLIWDSVQQVNLLLNPYVSVIPLQKKHLDALMENMYTCRFVVKNGRAKRYSITPTPFTQSSPQFPGVPDGTYEFYYGKAWKIVWGGIAIALSPDHPLYKRDPQRVQRLFNLGIEMNTLFSPQSPNQTYFPSRYAYFRNGDLFTLGGPIFHKDDPILKSFIAHEKELEKQSSAEKPYVPFIDWGPPVKNGKIDKEFLNTFGLKIPKSHYLCLGDNHAMSADSRLFGFVPENNLEGAPSFIIWPPGHRWGPPLQIPYPWITIPNMIVWGIVLSIGLIWWAIVYYYKRRSFFKS
jgi:signal peptidase I